ncbi:restriction endonuclease subunit S [Brachyspira pilosicoli]|uniref:restriction endonuclease subunit S n=1 Tax=Brachyspira pilosicoli TaxID=52584 RepID=UPI001CA59D17|nr:restriction endonuclease subunit S [Brachyspira pilosicoli]MBW5400352.1 restriction endonuclease subunit S [Brachyspira pilosicoli]
MSTLKELLKKHCPDGVEYKTLSEIGEFSNIGVDKKKVDGEKEILLLNFMDVMKNMYIDKSIPKMVVTASDYKIEKCTIEEGDIFITPSSETIDEIGFASVITETIPNACYSYHIMRFRLFEYNMTTSIFIRYCFDSSFLRKQIRKSAQGITRFGLTLNKWKSLKIPFPPIEVQKEIVRILDTFTKYQDLLNRELELRKKQYEYYRGKLLTFGDEVEWKELKKVCTDFIVPMRDKPKVFDGNIPWCRIEDVEGKYFNTSLSGRFVSDKVIKEMNLKVFPIGTVICSCSASLGTYAINTQPLITNQTFIGIVCGDKLNNQYLRYYMETQTKKLVSLSNSGTIPYISRQKFEDLKIPVPPLEEQERIVNILDKFDALCNDITRGLPAEIELRKKQYEYYRDKLLTFKEKKK